MIEIRTRAANPKSGALGPVMMSGLEEAEVAGHGPPWVRVRGELIRLREWTGVMFDFDGTWVPFEEGDSVFTAVLRAGLRP